ncbi:MAG: DNA translocase FtsK [bacterium]|nr:DNA translocase FtsK [bacterium]
MLNSETKDSIVAIVAFLLAAVFIFAKFGKAGMIGVYAVKTFTTLLGQGYFLLPVVLIMVGSAILFSLKQKFVVLPIVGAGIFLISGLSLAEVVFGNSNGGLVGSTIATPLLYLFDPVLSGLILSGLIIISFLVIFNASLLRAFAALRKEKENPLDALNRPVFPPVAEVTVSEPLEEIIDDEPELPIEAPLEIPKKEVHKGVDPAMLKRLKEQAANYTLPPLTLLNNDKGTPSAGDVKANGNIIQRTLQDFGIPVEMGEVNVGPSVTQYTFKPAQGIRLSRITGLHNDLALALAAHPLRIEAPIPGRSFVGIEIPNRTISLVGLRSLLDQEEYQKGGPLTFAIGKNVAGAPMYADLAKMPHMLVAGATGAGKSVAIHSILMSLLYKNTPLSLRLLMIDPKRVELAHYQDIPHLLTPVITESKEAIASLRWAVKEMEERYRILQAAKSRDIISYNSSNKEEFMPYVVIVIDELADLMSSYGREVEASIVRIAQMARAVGIHLIVSTQRPSVEVITGLIKANITCRMSFAVASQIDSRTILDMAGAEKLLGNGDMLFLSGDAGKPRRVQGAFVSEKEVKGVTSFILNQDTEPDYNKDVIAVKVGGGSGVGMGDDDADDDLYEDAFNVVMEAQKASTTFIQRRLKVGYARAARLMDMLEERGIVGPGEGAKPREILYQQSQQPDPVDPDSHVV